MTDSCFYCEKDERLSDLMVKVAELETSILYLNKDQTHTGRSIVAFNSHKKELFELSADELRQFSKDVANAAQALQQAFAPHKINYAIYGDHVSHLHVHLVPKYDTDEDWGSAFVHAPLTIKTLEAEGYQRSVDQIHRHLL